MKFVKSIAMVIAISLILSCTVFAGITASAAFVIDGNSFTTAGDVNEDQAIDVCDLVASLIKYEATAGSNNWSPAADLDGDNKITGYDFALIRAIILDIDNVQWTE